MNKFLSICIATCKRPEMLKCLLESIYSQKRTEEVPPYELVVIDNSIDGSAKDVVSTEAKKHSNIKLTYDIQTEKNIALTRNLAMQHAKGSHIVFIDDDEIAVDTWLVELYVTMNETGAAAVFGPVLCRYPSNTHSWILRGDFYQIPAQKDRSVVKLGYTGNVIFDRKWTNGLLFEKSLGLTGGSDSVFFEQIRLRGGLLIHSAKAIVSEEVETKRLTIRWLVMRAFRKGQCYSDLFLQNKSILYKVLYISIRLVAAIVLLLISIGWFPFGLDRFVKIIRYGFLQLGHASVAIPYRYKEYR